MIPTNMASEKPCSCGPPATSIATTTSCVSAEVVMVRPSVWVSDTLHTVKRSTRRILRKFSRTRS